MTIQDIAKALGARAEGDAGLAVSGPNEPARATSDELALAMDPAYAPDLSAGAARAAILWDGADWKALGLAAAIFVPRARYAMAGVTALFDAGRAISPGIHETAVIDASARIAPDVAIGPFVVIGPDVEIGAGAVIAAHCTIADRARLGPNARLFEGVRIGHDVRLGTNVTLHANVVLGSDGFSYVTPKPGAIDTVKATLDLKDDHDEQEFARIHSLGTVEIGDTVEIGANTAIDRGTIRNTVIGAGTKIDNLVHIGHNVVVGRTCLLCGQVGIAGSTKIGDRVVLGGQVGVADHVTVGDNVIAAGKSGISSNVPPNRAIMGNPAIKMDANIASYRVYRRLPKLAEKLEALQKLVSNRPPTE